MAGGGDLAASPRGKKKGGAKKKKRVGYNLDMTPLVDVAFLLLTFFMFATTMAQPQMMEMQIPPDISVPVEVKQSELMTLYVRGDGKVYYNTGIDPVMRPLEMKQIRDFSVQKNTELGNRLITILKIDQAAPYSRLVDVLDELNLAEGDLVEKYAQTNVGKRERRFSIVPMEEPDKQELAKL